MTAIAEPVDYLLEITSLRNHIAQLENHNRVLATIIEQLPVAVAARTASDQRYILWNKAAENLTGVSSDQILGQTAADSLSASQSTLFPIDNPATLLSSHPTTPIEATIDHPLYGLRTVRGTHIPFCDEAGTPVYLTSIFEDITLWKQAREQQVAANERLSRIFETSPLATIEFDLAGIIQRWNPAAERIFGWSAAEAIGRELLPLVVPDLAMEHVQGVLQALLRGQITHSRNENITRDQQIITCQWYNSILRDEDGNVIGLLSQTADITAQVQQENSLRVYQTIVENAPDSIHMTDTHGRFTYVNPAFQKLFGYGNEIIGQSFISIMAEDAAVLARDQERMQQDGSMHRQIQVQRQDHSQFSVQGSIFLIQNERGEVQSAGAILRDLTDQQRAEIERAALQQQVIEAQHAALRELSTPLIPISDTAVVMPLIGTIDSTRAMQVLETLLEGVASHRATIAILDITGVQVIDTQVASALIRAAQAVKLLGSQVVLTGIRPDVAQTLVHLGIDLNGIITLGSLQAGIAYALRQATTQKIGTRTHVNGR